MSKFKLNFVRILLLLADIIVNHLFGMTLLSSFVLSVVVSVVLFKYIDITIEHYLGDFLAD